MPAQMRKVDSSNIASVGWADGILRVQFHSGGTYEYDNVPQVVYNRLLTAPSIGEWFADNIRNQFAARKVAD